MTMMEVRPRVLRGGVQIGAGVGARYMQPGVVGVVGTGIFRGMDRASQAARRVLSPEENKENIPPPPPPRREGSGMPRSRSRRKPNKKSPLPVWYPRTPLRDITAIVNAMQNRTRLRAAAAAAARQSQSAGSPLQQESGGSPLDPALGASSPADEVVSPDLSSVASPLASVQKAFSSSEEIPKAAEESDSLLQHSPTSDSIVKAITPASNQISAPGKNLVDHIDVIKKLIRDQELRKEAVKPKSVKRSTLLSMR